MSDQVKDAPPIKPPVHPAVAVKKPDPQPRQKCVVSTDPDGSMVVTFVVGPYSAKIFERQCNGGDMAKFLWETRGLRHFENQRIV